jgi:hypothetical protein
VAMTLRGHKTRPVFDRYNVVSEGDLTEAAAKLGALTGALLDTSGRRAGEAILVNDTLVYAGVAELADAQDLKSCGPQGP